jgi:hypothetical protein
MAALVHMCKVSYDGWLLEYGRKMYCISQKAWTLFWKIIFAPAFTSHSYGVLGNLVD